MNTTFHIFLMIFWIFGTLSNIISILMCLRKELRKTPTFVFMAFMAFLNICSLITLVISPISLKFINLELIDIHIIIGKINVFITLWSQSSSYLQVSNIKTLF